MNKEVRLIDANALLDHLTPVISYHYYNYHFSAVHEIHIHEAPTIDAAPVRHGKWIGSQYNRFGYVCSECTSAMSVKTNYCYQCGAKMDGGSENG